MPFKVTPQVRRAFKQYPGLLAAYKTLGRKFKNPEWVRARNYSLRGGRKAKRAARYSGMKNIRQSLYVLPRKNSQPFLMLGRAFEMLGQAFRRMA